MATGKKSILVYADWIHTFETLDDDEAGKLIKHFFRYVNDLDPTPPDKITKVAFEPIKQHLKRDLIKYDGIKETRSGAGKASAEKRKREAEELNKTQQNQQVLKVLNKAQQSSTNPTVNVNGNVNNINVIYKTEILNSQTWLEQTAMKNSTSLENLKNSFDDFWVNNDYDTNEENKTASEIKKHFFNWLKTNKPKELKIHDEWGERSEDYHPTFIPDNDYEVKEMEAMGWVIVGNEMRLKIVKKAMK